MRIRGRSARPTVMAIVAPVLFAVIFSPPGGARQESEAQKPVALVRFPFPHDDGQLTPYTFDVGYGLLTLIYDTLMWRDAGGVPQPWLAQSVETSPDGRRVTLRLSEGARWHDGRAFTSADVAFTFRFVTARPHARFSSQLAAVERVETPDPATAVVVLRHPSPGFADQPLADVPILPAHLWERIPMSQSAPEGLPVGSGPYRLAHYEPGKSYRFEANPDYFRGPPVVSALEVPFIGNADEMLEAMRRREVDMIPVSLSDELAERVRSLGIRAVDGPSYLGTVLTFNLRQPPFDRLEVRQGVARAIDLRALTRSVGAAVPATRGYLHPGSPWASGDVLHPPRRAEAGELTPLGLPPLAVLTSSVDPVKRDAARRVVAALKRAGAEAEVRELPREELAKAMGKQGATPSFQLAIGVSPALASYDPDFLAEVFSSDPRIGRLNDSGYKSEAFDALATRISSTADPGARKAAVDETLRLLANDVPVLPLLFAEGAFTYRPSVYKGWVFVKGAGILDKRSFLVGEATTSTTVPPKTTTDPGIDTDSGGGPPWTLIVLGVFGVAALGVVVELIRRRG